VSRSPRTSTAAKQLRIAAIAFAHAFDDFNEETDENDAFELKLAQADKRLEEAAIAFVRSLEGDAP
jgi:hypothetical protein